MCIKSYKRNRYQDPPFRTKNRGKEFSMLFLVLTRDTSDLYYMPKCILSVFIIFMFYFSFLSNKSISAAQKLMFKVLLVLKIVVSQKICMSKHIFHFDVNYLKLLDVGWLRGEKIYFTPLTIHETRPGCIKM